LPTDCNSITPLGLHVELKRGTTYKSSLLNQPGPILLGLASIEPDGGFRRGSLKTYGGDSPDPITLKAGDMYVSLKDVTQSGDLLGAVARVPADIKVGRLTQDTVKLILKADSAPAEYLFWLLRTPQYRAYCRARAIGTTNLALPRDDFLSFPVPPLTPTRTRLAELLSLLDDKIELNRRINETLEQISEATFVRACRGSATASFSHLVDVHSGGTPKTSVPSYWDGGIPWFSVVDAPRLSDVFVTTTERTISADGLAGSAADLMPAETTIITARGTVGKVALTAVPMAINQSCYGLRGRGGYGAYFTYFSTRRVVEALRRRSHGSVFETITRRTFEGLEVSAPPPTAAAQFEEDVRPYFHRILANLLESETLADLRDTLLPKLISGEVRVRGTAG
jgi:hypothetical protein